MIEEWVEKTVSYLETMAGLGCACKDSKEACLGCLAKELLAAKPEFTEATPSEHPGWTPAEFARHAGLSKGTVLRGLHKGLLRGEQSPSGRWRVFGWNEGAGPEAEEGSDGH